MPTVRPHHLKDRAVQNVAAGIGGSVGVLNDRGELVARHDAGDPAAADAEPAPPGPRTRRLD